MLRGGTISNGPLSSGIASIGLGGYNQLRHISTIGDSMTAANNAVKTITAATRTSNVVTATATSHGLIDGGYVAIANISPNDFNKSRAQVTVVDANTFTYAATGADGSGANLSGSKAMHLMDYQNQTDRGIPVWMADISLGYIDQVVVNGGGNGDTAADMLVRTPDILSNSTTADDVMFLCGYNDFAIEHRTAAAVYSDVVSIVQLIRAMGKRAIVISALPWNTGGTSTDRGEAARYNRLMSAYAAANYGVVFVDAARKLIDPTSGTPFSAQAAYLNADSIHPNASGVRLIAQEVLNTAYSGYPYVSRLATTAADVYSYDSSSKNILSYGPYGSAAAGTLGTNVTGSVCTGFTAGCSASASAVASVVANSDGTNYKQRLVLTSAGAAQWVRLILTSNITTGFSVGDTIRFTGRVTLSGVSGSNLYGINAYITTNAVTSYALTASNTSSSYYPQTDRTLTFIGPSMILPSGTSFINFYIYILCSAAGSAITADIDGLTIVKQ